MERENHRPRLGRGLIGMGYAIVGIAAVMTPVAYSLDLLDTLPAIALALVLIGIGIGIVVTGDRLSDEGPIPYEPPPPQDNSSPPPGAKRG